MSQNQNQRQQVYSNESDRKSDSNNKSEPKMYRPFKSNYPEPSTPGTVIWSSGMTQNPDFTATFIMMSSGNYYS